MKKTVYLKKSGVYAAFLLPVFVCGIAGGDTFFNIAVSLVAVTYLLMLNDGMRAAYLLCAVYAVSYAVVGVCVRALRHGGVSCLRVAPHGGLSLCRFREKTNRRGHSPFENQRMGRRRSLAAPCLRARCISC